MALYPSRNLSTHIIARPTTNTRTACPAVHPLWEWRGLSSFKDDKGTGGPKWSCKYSIGVTILLSWASYRLFKWRTIPTVWTGDGNVFILLFHGKTAGATFCPRTYLRRSVPARPHGQMTCYCQDIIYSLITKATKDTNAKADIGISSFKLPNNQDSFQYAQALCPKYLRCAPFYEWNQLNWPFKGSLTIDSIKNAPFISYE